MRSALPEGPAPDLRAPADPVARARGPGGRAGKVVVVDNPKRRLEDRLPEGVEVAVQERAEGHRRRGRRRRRHIDADATVVVLPATCR